MVVANKTYDEGMNNNTHTICEVAERTVFATRDSESDPFTMPIPQAYFIKDTEQNIHIWEDFSSPEVADIYELMLRPEVVSLAADSDAVMFVTTGWASPIGDDDDTPPSRHHARRRVRLSVCGTKDGMASAVRFADAPDEVTVDEGHGALADALRDLLSRVVV